MYKTTKYGTGHKVIETETGNTVATVEEMPSGWWAWAWTTGYNLLRNDYAGKTLEEVIAEADDWI